MKLVWRIVEHKCYFHWGDYILTEYCLYFGGFQIRMYHMINTSTPRNHVSNIITPYSLIYLPPIYPYPSFEEQMEDFVVQPWHEEHPTMIEVYRQHHPPKIDSEE